MGDPDLSPEERVPAGRREPTRSAGSEATDAEQARNPGRGLVVFPADREADAGPPRTERWIGRYLAFLATVAVGAVVVAIIAIVIGH